MSRMHRVLLFVQRICTSHFPDSRNLFIVTGIRVNWTDVEDGITLDHAVGKEPRSCTLDVHPAHRVDVPDDIVGDLGATGR